MDTAVRTAPRYLMACTQAGLRLLRFLVSHFFVYFWRLVLAGRLPIKLQMRRAVSKTLPLCKVELDCLITLAMRRGLELGRCGCQNCSDSSLREGACCPRFWTHTRESCWRVTESWSVISSTNGWARVKCNVVKPCLRMHTCNLYSHFARK